MPRIKGRDATRGLCQPNAPIHTDELKRLAWLTGPALRRMFGISAMTLWRWRHISDFPIPKRINGRLYFAADQIEAWVTAQKDARG
jgi:predicted DNA-binding transcriptional regulator AlpA